METPADHLGQVGLSGGGGAETDASGGGFLHGFHHLGSGVAENHRPPGAEVIEVAIAVGIPEIGALGADDEGRLAADSAKRTHRRIDAAWQAEFQPAAGIGGNAAWNATDGVIDIQYRRRGEIPKRAACDATLMLPGMVVFRDFTCPQIP